MIEKDVLMPAFTHKLKQNTTTHRYTPMHTHNFLKIKDKKKEGTGLGDVILRIINFKKVWKCPTQIKLC